VGLITASKDRIVSKREELSKLRQKHEKLQKTLQQVLCVTDMVLLSAAELENLLVLHFFRLQ